MKKLLALLGASLLISTALFAAKSDILISAKEAKKLLGNPNVVFVSGDSPDSFPTGHIPGSVVMGAHHLHHSDITGSMHCSPLYQCIEDAEHHIGEKGIDNNTLVIAYDDFRGPNSTGVYHFFKVYGHKNVKILNGGRAAMEKAGVKMEKGPEKKRKAKHYHINPKHVNYDIVADKYEVLKASNDITETVEKKGDKRKSRYVIIDARAMNEIIGDRKLDNVARGGHIPGATFIEWKQVTDFKNKLSFPNDLSEVKKKLERLGITKDKTVYAYCHVGTGRGSYFYTVLKLLGYPHVKVYTGSWDEWGNDQNLPIRK